MTVRWSFVSLQQRGKIKEEVFAKKIHEITMEEEKMRIPIAQGLPWTTDEPEVSMLCFLLTSHLILQTLVSNSNLENLQDYRDQTRISCYESSLPENLILSVK